VLSHDSLEGKLDSRNCCALFVCGQSDFQLLLYGL